MTFKKIKLAVFFSGMVFILPFLTPLFLSKGLSAFEILLMQGIYMAAITILEVPSGAFSDKFGRKITLVIAFSAFLLAWCSLFFAEDFISFLPYQLLFALGTSFKSGTFMSYLYEKIKKDEGKENFGKRIAEIKGTGTMAAFIGAIGGTLLFRVSGFYGVMLTTLICYLVAFLCICTLPKLKNVCVEEEKNYLKIIKNGFNELSSSENIKVGATEAITLGVVLGTFFHLNQIILKNSGFPVKFNGLFIAAVYLSTTLIMKHIGKIMSRYRNDFTVIKYINFLLAIAICIMPFVHNTYIVVTILFGVFIMNNIRQPFSTRILNENIGDENRATTLSYISLMKNLGGMILAPIIGYLFEKPHGFILIGIIIGGVLLVNAIIVQKHHKKRDAERKEITA